MTGTPAGREARHATVKEGPTAMAIAARPALPWEPKPNKDLDHGEPAHIVDDVWPARDVSAPQPTGAPGNAETGIPLLSSHRPARHGHGVALKGKATAAQRAPEALVITQRHRRAPCRIVPMAMHATSAGAGMRHPRGRLGLHSTIMTGYVT